MTFAHYKKSVHYFKRGQDFAHIYQLFRGNSSVWHESNVPQMKSDRYQLVSRHKKKSKFPYSNEPGLSIYRNPAY